MAVHMKTFLCLLSSVVIAASPYNREFETKFENNIEFNNLQTNIINNLHRDKRSPQYYYNPYQNQQTRNFGGGALSSAGRVALTHAGKSIVSAGGNDIIDRNGWLDTNTYQENRNIGGFLAGGAAGGVAIGAAVGSVVPVVGTALGAAIGAVAGSGVALLATKVG